MGKYWKSVRTLPDQKSVIGKVVKSFPMTGKAMDLMLVSYDYDRKSVLHFSLHWKSATLFRWEKHLSEKSGKVFDRHSHK